MKGFAKRPLNLQRKKKLYLSLKQNSQMKMLWLHPYQLLKKIMENAPRVPKHPSEDMPASPADESRVEAPITPRHPSQDGSSFTS